MLEGDVLSKTHDKCRCLRPKLPISPDRPLASKSLRVELLANGPTEAHQSCTEQAHRGGLGGVLRRTAGSSINIVPKNRPEGEGGSGNIRRSRNARDSQHVVGGSLKERVVRSVAGY